MSGSTSNFSWILPTVNGDNNIWGGNTTGLNKNLIDQDTLIRNFMNTFLSATAPVAPSIAQSGTMWINSTSAPWVLNVYNAGTTTWIPMGTIDTVNNVFNVTGSSSSSSSANIGDYKISAQPSNHSQWLICDGTAVSRATYSGLAALFASLTPQYPFGTGDGSTTFNLPDLRGRVGGGIGAGSGLTVRVVGTATGEETHVLTVPEMPSHNHTFNPKSDSATNGTTPATAIGVSTRNNTIPIANTTFIENTGGGGAHNNMQPTLFAGNYFIYAGV